VGTSFYRPRAIVAIFAFKIGDIATLDRCCSAGLLLYVASASDPAALARSVAITTETETWGDGIDTGHWAQLKERVNMRCPSQTNGASWPANIGKRPRQQRPGTSLAERSMRNRTKCGPSPATFSSLRPPPQRPAGHSPTRSTIPTLIGASAAWGGGPRCKARTAARMVMGDLPCGSIPRIRLRS